MKKRISKLLLTGLLFTGFLVFPFMVFAQLETPPHISEIVDKDPDTFELADFLRTIADWILWLVILVAFVFIVIAGYNFITAGGDPEKIGKARSQLIYALVGVAVALLAWALISWVATFLGVTPEPLTP